MWVVQKVIPLGLSKPIVWWSCTNECGSRMETSDETTPPSCPCPKCGVPAAGPSPELPSTPGETLHPNLGSLFDLMMRESRQGCTWISEDDPGRKLIGFRNETYNTWHLITIPDIKTHGLDNLPPTVNPGIQRAKNILLEYSKTPHGRVKLAAAMTRGNP